MFLFIVIFNRLKKIKEKCRYQVFRFLMKKNSIAITPRYRFTATCTFFYFISAFYPFKNLVCIFYCCWIAVLRLTRNRTRNWPSSNWEKSIIFTYYIITANRIFLYYKYYDEFQFVFGSIIKYCITRHSVEQSTTVDFGRVGGSPHPKTDRVRDLNCVQYCQRK